MKRTIIWKAAIEVFTLCIILPGLTLSQTSEKARLIILADMGNEADEMQQNIHLLMYSDVIEIEGLIAQTGIFWKKPPAYWYYDSLINAYEKVVDNLKLHSPDFPSPDYLRSIRGPGNEKYGIEETGPGKSSFGSKRIIEALLEDDPRPVNFAINAGSNTLAQALKDLDARYNGDKNEAEMESICKKIYVYENGAQGNSGAWLIKYYPAIHWIRSNYQTYAHMGGGVPYTWQPFSTNVGEGQHAWVNAHIQTNHGALGAQYPDRIWQGNPVDVEGGGTSPWIGLANRGLYDPRPGRHFWGGWGGRFTREKEKNYFSRWSDNVGQVETPFYCYTDQAIDTWTNPEDGKTTSDNKIPVSRWRRTYNNDFRGRMDWCVKPYDQANHNPIAAFNGDTQDTIIVMYAKPEDEITLDASASMDPDQNPLEYSWFIYPEAGTYNGDISIPNSSDAKTSLAIPSDADNKQIHVILQVNDISDVADESGVLKMYDFRRIVINVSSTHVNTLPESARHENKIFNQPGGFTTNQLHPNINKVLIFKLDGSLVDEIMANNGHVSISNLQKGLYLIKDGFAWKRKVVVY